MKKRITREGGMLMVTYIHKGDTVRVVSEAYGTEIVGEFLNEGNHSLLGNGVVNNVYGTFTLRSNGRRVREQGRISKISLAETSEKKVWNSEMKDLK